MSILDIRKLSVNHSGKQLLKNIVLQVPSGQAVCILGKNGAGKSTLMRALTGFYPHFEGDAIVAGCSLRHHPRRKYMQGIGGIIETPALYDHLSVEENLRVVAQYYPKETGITANRIQEVLVMVGLQDERQKRVRALSQGKRQRLGLAIAILHRPKVVLLDEPTSNLDPAFMQSWYALIRQLKEKEQISFLINTHNFHEVEEVADSWVILKEGEIVFRSEDPAAAQETDSPLPLSIKDIFLAVHQEA
ncbi:MAG: hypothetical protein KatS3mg033_2275 [Thermonema sp.]|uniref:ABC transporter ATP-binding protein n=1 Tax=Thermonema TaxID=28194 RepID=UPI0006893AB6|nr:MULTISPECIES: ABC transporter ATP-binding protein [Thermonema]GIV40475.1 MAG: hypothetical protein KatS3mg033_2275 [Thermonema sp.]